MVDLIEIAYKRDRLHFYCHKILRRKMDLKEQELAEQYLRDYDKALEEYELPEAVGPIEAVHLQ